MTAHRECMFSGEDFVNTAELCQGQYSACAIVGGGPELLIKR